MASATSGGAGRSHDRGWFHRVPPRVVELVGGGETGRIRADQRTIQACSQRGPVGRARRPGCRRPSARRTADARRGSGVRAARARGQRPRCSPQAGQLQDLAAREAGRAAQPGHRAGPTDSPAGRPLARSVSRASCRMTTAATWSTTAPALAFAHPGPAQRLLGAHRAQPFVDEPDGHRGHECGDALGVAPRRRRRRTLAPGE